MNAQTIPPATVSSLARAIPQQKIDKGRIWLICILGAAGLFVGTVLVENNDKFFPAISKANKALALARKSQEVHPSSIFPIRKSCHCDKVDLQ